ncbi:MAG: ribosomal protein [Ignavibacteria bacterium]|nr:ribosomal protein [Ignavibacteria bacterium]
MASISVIARNDKRKRLAKKYEERREIMKAKGDWVGLQKLPRNSAPTRIVSRCTMTGRGRGVYKKFGLCRNMLRLMALEGKIPGLRKASW